jgi:hypothetical protein
MIHKFGTLLDATIVDTSGPIVKFASKELVDLSPEHVYFRAVAVYADKINGNGDRFSKDEIKRCYASFKGGHVDYEHKTDEKHIVGRIVDAYLVDDAETGECYVEILGTIDKKLHPEIARLVETKVLNKVSMESLVERSICSVCGHTMRTNDDPKCYHLAHPGQKFMVDGVEKIAYSINEGTTFTGVGIVLNPAEKKAMVKDIFASLSWNAEELLKTPEEKLVGDQRLLVASLQESLISTGDSPDDVLASCLKKLSAFEFIRLTRMLKGNKKAEEVSVTATSIDPSKSVVGRAVFFKKAKIDDSYWIFQYGKNYFLKATLRQIWGNQLEDIMLGKVHSDLPSGWYANPMIYGRAVIERFRTNGAEEVKKFASELKLRRVAFRLKEETK